MRLLPALICLSAPAFADPTHLSLSAGLGHSHSILGARLELADEHWGGFAAASLTNLHGDPGFAGGVRWTTGDRKGLVLSLHSSVFQQRAKVSYLGRSTLVIVAATVGYRFRYQRLWAEAAVGPALFIDSHHREDSVHEDQIRFERQIGYGSLGGQDNPRWPDVELAVGFEL